MLPQVLRSRLGSWPSALGGRWRETDLILLKCWFHFSWTPCQSFVVGLSFFTHWPWPSVSSLAVVETAVFRPSAPPSCPFKPKASQGHAYRTIQHFSFEAPFNTSDSVMRGCNRLRYRDERCEMFFFFCAMLEREASVCRQDSCN